MGAGFNNRELAEAFFELAEREPLGQRRVALLRAGYTALDATHPARSEVVERAPRWLKPLAEQIAACRGPGALEAAVQRLSAGGTPRRTAARDRYLARTDVSRILSEGPADLSPQRMRGAFHWHTRDSDGRAPLEVMARVCGRRGASWAVVSDHSRGLEVASGLDAEGLRLQRQRVERWNRANDDGVRLIQGLEVEILEDGTLDVPRGERLDVDCVVAAVHRRLAPDKDQTERLVRAIATPGVHVLAHPRGRLFHYRPGLKARWERVFSVCAEEGVAVEINGFPRRQDLDWDLARLAHDCGCLFLLASDAHAPRHLDFDAYACAIATQAGIPASRVLNTKQPEAFEDWLASGV